MCSRKTVHMDYHPLKAQYGESYCCIVQYNVRFIRVKAKDGTRRSELETVMFDWPPLEVALVLLEISTYARLVQRPSSFAVHLDSDSIIPPSRWVICLPIAATSPNASRSVGSPSRRPPALDYSAVVEHTRSWNRTPLEPSCVMCVVALLCPEFCGLA